MTVAWDILAEVATMGSVLLTLCFNYSIDQLLESLRFVGNMKF